MSVTVAEEGNRRVGGPTVSEVGQSVLDVLSWFGRSSEWSGDGAKCTKADFQRLEKTMDMELPQSLKALLSEADGGLWFMDKLSFTTQQIAETYADNEASRLWKGSYLPFAGDDSTLLVVDTAAGDAVHEWDTDEGLGDRLADSLGAYLESYRDQLLSGQYEYLDGCGVIEKVGASKSKK